MNKKSKKFKMICILIIVGIMLVQLSTVSYAAANTGRVVLSDPSSYLNVRSGPGTTFSIVGILYHGDIVTVLGIDNGWYRIKYKTWYGYVSSDYIIVN